jgi:hypothetical protein
MLLLDRYSTFVFCLFPTMKYRIGSVNAIITIINLFGHKMLFQQGPSILRLILKSTLTQLTDLILSCLNHLFFR